MIIKSLLFIILCIFVYETYKTILKMTEEYFTMENTNFINNKINSATEYNSLDTLYYKSFKPLEYDEDRAYYWRRDKLVEEGIRRNQADLKKIQNLQTLFENETDEKNKKKLQDELDLYKWRDSILKSKDKNTGLSRDKRDIITDYYPEEIGLQRPWIERHSHLPNYSY